MNRLPGLRVLTRSEHSIQDSAIHPDAWKVLRRLHQAGHTAYLVGGTTRDLYLGRPPKDFDAATTARPNEIKRLFRNAFMIGRRFRLAHIKFPDNIIEVATFRQETDRFEEPVEGQTAKAIRLYGTPEEDARRRDFTINGLFYDPFRGHLIDYVGGLADMERRLVRTIIPPDQSFEEDPARMIRAVRAAGRLGFAVEVDTHQAIIRNREKILRCPRARLLEESMILLKHNSAERSVRLLWQFGLMEYILTVIHQYLLRRDNILLEPPKPDLLFDLLAMLDIETTPVDPSVFFSLLIFPLVLEEMKIAPNQFWANRSTGAVVTAAENALNELSKPIEVSKKFRARALEILTVQSRFILRQNQGRPEKLASKPYFMDSFRFFHIATRAVELDVSSDIAVWKKCESKQPVNFQHPPTAQNPQAFRGPDRQNFHRGRNRRRRRGRHGGGSGATAPPSHAQDSAVAQPVTPIDPSQNIPQP